jgi:hypothetical protein
MQKGLLRKGLVLGIILLFVGTSVTPSISKNIENNKNINKDLTDRGGNILVYVTDTNGFYPKEYFDQDLPQILVNHGYSVTITDRIETAVITSQLLSAYNELWIMSSNPLSNGCFSSDEISTILNFRLSGKGLLIAADHDGMPGPHHYINDANQISVPLGVQFYGSKNHPGIITPVLQIPSHPLWLNVVTFEGVTDEADMYVNSPTVVIATYQGNNFVAARDDGNGRVVFHVCFARFGDTNAYDGDMDQFIRNIADWLMGSGSQPPNEGLVGYWSFNEGSGTVAHDYSGNGNDGTIYGATWTTGVSENALIFDGINDYIDLLDTASVRGLSSFTIGAWIKTTGTNTPRYICSEDSYNQNGAWARVEFYVEAYTEKIVLDVRPHDGDDYGRLNVISTIALTPGTWHFIVGTWVTDGTTITVTLYIDGPQNAQTSTYASISAISDSPPYNGVNYIGGTRNQPGSGWGAFYGSIDEVSLYNGALSEEEIWSLYYSNYLPPNPEFDWNPQYPKPNQLITFDAAGSYAENDYYITSYEWDFDNDEDYSDATGITATCSWSVGGDHEIGLKVTDNRGVIGIDRSIINVNRPPTAVIESISPNPAGVNEDITFRASAIDEDGDAITYIWRDSNNQLYNGLDTEFTMKLSKGHHDIFLAVQDEHGEYSILWQRDWIDVLDGDLYRYSNYVYNCDASFNNSGAADAYADAGLGAMSAAATTMWLTSHGYSEIGIEVNKPGVNYVDVTAEFLNAGGESGFPSSQTTLTLANAVRGDCPIKWSFGAPIIKSLQNNIPMGTIEDIIKMILGEIPGFPGWIMTIWDIIDYIRTLYDAVQFTNALHSEKTEKTIIEGTLPLNGGDNRILISLHAEANGGVIVTGYAARIGQLSYINVKPVNGPSEGQLVIIADCPIDLDVQDSSGYRINKTYSNISGASYLETDINADGEKDAYILIPNAINGNYSIFVQPKENVSQNDTYSIYSYYELNNDTIAENVSISNITSEPYLYPVSSLNPPYISLNYPTGDEILNNSVLIQWNASDNEDGNNLPISLSYSNDNNENWTIINEDLVNTGSYEWNTTSVPDGTYTLSLKTVDSNDNIRQVRSNPFIILNYEMPFDNQPPEILNLEGTTLGITNENYFYNVNSTDLNNDQVFYWFSWGDGNNSGWLGPYDSNQTFSTFHNWSQDGNYQILVKDKDIYGFISNSSSTLNITIDGTPPVTTILFNGTLGNDNWYLSPVNITLLALDIGSGVNYTMYKLDENNWTIYSVSFLISDDGEHNISYYSVDTLGNIETIKSVNIYIDKTPPSTTHSFSGTIGNNGWYISDVIVTFIALDNQSGVNHTYYRIDNGSWIEYTAPGPIAYDGIHTLEYYSVDVAGNEEPVKGPFSLKIDKIPPAITLTKQQIDLFNVKFTAEVSDATSGIDRVEFTLDGTLQSNDTQSPYEWTWTGIGNHQVTATAYDLAGNSQSQSMSTPYSFNMKYSIQMQFLDFLIKQQVQT